MLLILSVFSFVILLCIHKAFEKKRNIFNLNKFCAFFYSNIFQRTHLKLAFLMYVSLCQNTELHVMNDEKIQQRLYNL